MNRNEQQEKMKRSMLDMALVGTGYEPLSEAQTKALIKAADIMSRIVSVFFTVLLFSVIFGVGAAMGGLLGFTWWKAGLALVVFRFGYDNLSFERANMTVQKAIAKVLLEKAQSKSKKVGAPYIDRRSTEAGGDAGLAN